MTAPSIGYGIGKGLQALVAKLPEGSVQEIFKDDDGIWLFLNEGWRSSEELIHQYHEMTARDMIRMVRSYPPVVCENCRLKRGGGRCGEA